MTDAATHVHLDVAVAAFLLEILNSVSLNVAAPNFEEQATMIIRAKNQLAAEPKETGGTGSVALT